VTGGGSDGNKWVEAWGTGTIEELGGNTGVAGGVGWGVGFGVGLTTTTRGKLEGVGGVDGSRTDGTTVETHDMSLLGIVRDGVERGSFDCTTRIGNISQIIRPTLVLELA
jgi:hypothetical protein